MTSPPGTHRGRPAQAASEAPTPIEAAPSLGHRTHTQAARLVDFAEHFQRRVLQDALAEATRSYWLRRAATFDAVGNDPCDEIAQACRAAAALAIVQDDELPGLMCPLCRTPTSPWSCSCGQTRIEAPPWAS